MAENKTKIIITRTSQWINRARFVKILIDGREAGAVKNASSEEFAVDAGTHKVRSKMSWYSSPEFEVNIKQDEIIYLKTKSTASLYWPLYFLLLIGVYVGFTNKGHQASRPEWILWVELLTIFPFVLYTLYFLTIGKKKYFKIEEDKDNLFAK